MSLSAVNWLTTLGVGQLLAWKSALGSVMGGGRWPGENVRELAGRVDSLALAVEVGVAHAVGVVVTAVGVALAGEAVVGVGSAAVLVFADVVRVLLACVRREGEGVGVGLPIVEVLDPVHGPHQQPVLKYTRRRREFETRASR